MGVPVPVKTPMLVISSSTSKNRLLVLLSTVDGIATELDLRQVLPHDMKLVTIVECHW